MSRSLQEGRRLALDHQQSRDLSHLLPGPGLSLYSGIGAPVGMGTEVAKSPGTCQGPRIMLKEVQENSPASSSSGSGAKYSHLSCRTQRPHGSSPLDLRQGQASAGSPACKVWGQALRTILQEGTCTPRQPRAPVGAPARRVQGMELALLRPWFKYQLCITQAGHLAEGALSPVCLSLPICAQG